MKLLNIIILIQSTCVTILLDIRNFSVSLNQSLSFLYLICMKKRFSMLNASKHLGTDSLVVLWTLSLALENFGLSSILTNRTHV